MDFDNDMTEDIFDIDCPDFDIDIAEFEGLDGIDELDFSFETEQKRYINPGRKKITSKPVKYRNAVQLAKQIGNIKRDDRFFIFLDGLFVFGDFIEAWIINNNYNVLEMTISTLSLSENNVDSLKTLLDKDYLQSLNMIVSDYFFSHEKRGLIPYMYQELDVDNKFQLAVARVHTKICLIKTECGREIIIHGSANLRTSGNVEQIVIETDQDLYRYNDNWHKEVIEKYKTINKSVGGEALWGQDQADSNQLTHIENGLPEIKKVQPKHVGQPSLPEKNTPTPSRSKAW